MKRNFFVLLALGDSVLFGYSKEDNPSDETSVAVETSMVFQKSVTGSSVNNQIAINLFI